MKYIVPLGALLLFAATPALSQDRLLSFQGYVEEDGLPLNGNYTTIFALWDAPAGGISSWSETHVDVPFTDGICHVLLGGINILKYVDLSQFAYLALTVEGQPITPRIHLASAPSALTVVPPVSLSIAEPLGHVLSAINLDAGSASYGVIGKSASPTGYGVWGEATSTASGSAKGVVGVSKLDAIPSAGVYGSGPYGVWGQSAYGPAVYGNTTATNGSGIGVHGKTSSPSGSGIMGSTAGPDGPSRGVWGSTNNSQGYGGYFEGGVAVYAKAEDNATADVLLAGNDNTSDNGWISSDPFYLSSDLILTANDDINIQIDRNNDEDGILYVSANGNTTSIFSVEEDGDVRVNGSLVHSSDRAAKEAFESVDPQKVLTALARMPVDKWRYIGSDVTHIGPVAQDFMAAFEVGEDETGIATVDADGVALAAIKGLYELVKEQQAEIRELKQLLTAGR